jgi:hypothetical protein
LRETRVETMFHGEAEYDYAKLAQDDSVGQNAYTIGYSTETSNFAEIRTIAGSDHFFNILSSCIVINSVDSLLF